MDTEPIKILVWENLKNGTVGVHAKPACDKPVTVTGLRVIYRGGQTHTVTESDNLPKEFAPAKPADKTVKLAQIQPPYLNNVAEWRGEVCGLEVDFLNRGTVLLEDPELVSDLVRSSVKAFPKYRELAED